MTHIFYPTSAQVICWRFSFRRTWSKSKCLQMWQEQWASVTTKSLYCDKLDVTLTNNIQLVCDIRLMHHVLGAKLLLVNLSSCSLSTCWNELQYVKTVQGLRRMILFFCWILLMEHCSSFPFWLLYRYSEFYYKDHPVQQFVYFHSWVIVVILCGSEDLEHSGWHPTIFLPAHFLSKVSHFVSFHWPCPLQSVSLHQHCDEFSRLQNTQ